MSLVGFYISYQTISNLDHEDLFDKEVNIFYGIVAAITLLLVFAFEKRLYSETKKLNSFIATFIGLTIILGHFLILSSYKQRDKTPSQIYCVTKITDFNGVSIDFRKNGTYKLTSWSLGADIYRGNFTIKDSIITIDKSRIENCIVSNRFVIRQDGEIDSTGKQEKSIYQIDQQGRIINRSTDFRVVDDWNNK